MRALAVLNTKPVDSLPGLPTAAEAGMPQLLVINWFVLAAPTGTPAAIIERLNAEQLRLLKDAAFRDRIGELGADPLGSSAAEYAEHIRRQIDMMRRAVKVSGLRVE